MHIKKFVVVFDILIIVTITNIKSSKKKKFILNIFRMSRLLSPSRHSSQQKKKNMLRQCNVHCVYFAQKNKIQEEENFALADRRNKKNYRQHHQGVSDERLIPVSSF